jgi:hypothetical protein
LLARAVLLLYTDGLVERRHTGLDEGIAEVCRLLHEGRDAEPDQLASQIMQRLAPSDGYQDDVALLLYRHPAPLQIDFSADADRLVYVRTALRNWLIRAEVDPEQIHDVLIAAGKISATQSSMVTATARTGSSGCAQLSGPMWCGWLSLTPARGSRRGRRLGVTAVGGSHSCRR